jgi:hypothetical protein
MAKLDTQLEELATLSPAALSAMWEQVYESPAPLLSMGLLQMGIAFQLQAKKQGGVPAAIRRKIERTGEGGVTKPPAPELRPGTQLIREWQGRTISVSVEGDGYLFDGKHHTSLSAIAKLVTGAHWSGPRFFGLTARA